MNTNHEPDTEGNYRGYSVLVCDFINFINNNLNPMKAEITVYKDAIKVPGSMFGNVLAPILEDNRDKIKAARKGLKRGEQATISVTIPEKLYFGNQREDLKVIPVIPLEDD